MDALRDTTRSSPRWSQRPKGLSDVLLPAQPGARPLGRVLIRCGVRNRAHITEDRRRYPLVFDRAGLIRYSSREILPFAGAGGTRQIPFLTDKRDINSRISLRCVLPGRFASECWLSLPEEKCHGNVFVKPPAPVNTVAAWDLQQKTAARALAAKPKVRNITSFPPQFSKQPLKERALNYPT